MKKMAILFGILSTVAVGNEAKVINLQETNIISTTGFNEKLSQENKNVSIITKEDIQSKEYKNVSDILRENQNIVIQDTYFGPIVDLRGSGARSLSRVKVLVDGISINPIDESMGTLPIDTIPVNSIEKIEILPGSGAVINGTGTSGGIVNIITKSDLQKDYFAMDYGNSSFGNNKTSLSGGYNVTDNLYLNLGYTYLDGKGYRDRDDKNHGEINGGFAYKITDGQKISFKGSKFKGHEKTSNVVSKEKLAKNRKADGFPIDADSDRETYKINYEIKPTEDLTILTTLYKENFNRDFVENSITKEYKMKGTVGKDLKTVSNGSFNEKTKGVKLTGKYEYDKGQMVVGYDYSKTKLKRGNNIDIGGDFRRGPMSLPVKINVNILNDVYKDVHAIYGLNKYEINENLNLITGLRWERSKYGGDRISKTKVNYNLPPMMGGRPMEHLFVKNISEDKTSDDFAGELGLNYKYSDTGNTYFRYERGFISPMPGQITDKVKKGLEYKANDLKSEKSDNFEIGIRDSIFDNTFVSASTFASFTHDEITQTMGGRSNAATKWWTYQNLDKTRRLGMEISMEHYFDKLTLSEGVSYTNTKITKGEFKGDKIPLAPKGKVTLKAKYQLTDKLSTALTYNYIGKSQNREYNDKDEVIKTNISGYGKTDLSVEYKINDNFAVKAGVNNIFGKKYNYQTTLQGDIPAPRRTYFVGGSIKF